MAMVTIMVMGLIDLNGHCNDDYTTVVGIGFFFLYVFLCIEDHFNVLRLSRTRDPDVMVLHFI